MRQLIPLAASLTLVLAGCASTDAEVTTERADDGKLPYPQAIYVYDFAVSPAEVPSSSVAAPRLSGAVDDPNHTPKRDTLLRACEAVGRDPSTIEVSAQARLVEGDHRALREQAMAYGEAGVDHLVLIMPAADGPAGLQRLADEVAVPLRERFG